MADHEFIHRRACLKSDSLGRIERSMRVPYQCSYRRVSSYIT